MLPLIWDHQSLHLQNRLQDAVVAQVQSSLMHQHTRGSTRPNYSAQRLNSLCSHFSSSTPSSSGQSTCSLGLGPPRLWDSTGWGLNTNGLLMTIFFSGRILETLKRSVVFTQSTSNWKLPDALSISASPTTRVSCVSCPSKMASQMACDEPEQNKHMRKVATRIRN